ncbi:MAG: hypothetical protein GW859_07035 [Sphingomonadales bacterium]|nr:hypothetical protein [Sphingomonadales bacterium]
MALMASASSIAVAKASPAPIERDVVVRHGGGLFVVDLQPPKAGRVPMTFDSLPCAVTYAGGLSLEFGGLPIRREAK